VPLYYKFCYASFINKYDNQVVEVYKLTDQKESAASNLRVAEHETPWPGPIYSWYVVGVLMLAYTNSFIDRQILSLLVEPIRNDLDISDTQISLLAGLAFSVFYTVMGIPLARLADQSNRRNIIVAGIASWSFMTALCGAAQNFWQLFLARMGVGIGEATLSPAAFSIISDYFPKDRIARAFSVYSMGVYFGAGLALMIGGLVIQAVSAAPPVELPLIGSVYSWQLTFFAVSLLGLPILLLLFTIKEPLRRGTEAAAKSSDGATFKDLKVFIGENRWTIIWHFSAFSLLGIGIITYMIWTPTWFIRTYQWDAPKIGLVYGAMTFFLGTAGVYAGGFVADWFHQRGREDAILRATMYGGIVAIPFAIATPLMPNETLAVIGLGVTTFLLAFPQGLPAAALQVIAPNRLRAQITALYFLVGNLIALGIGPTMVALITDYFYGDPGMLPYSMALVCAIVIPLGVLAVWLSLRPYRASVERSKNITSKNSVR
jgi:MFS family permease